MPTLHSQVRLQSRGEIADKTHRFQGFNPFRDPLKRVQK